MKHLNSSLLIALLTLLMSTHLNAQRITVTVAGTGISGYTGDGVPGKQTMIGGVHDVCMDKAQNIYYTDMLNGRVRKISAQNGTVTTIAGGGTSFSEGIPATSASLFPRSMCIDDAGNIYVVSYSDQVRKIDAATNKITTIAGMWANGCSGDGGPATAARFNNITGICADKTGNIYLVDEVSNCVRKVDAGTGMVTTVAGKALYSGYTGDGGPATDATLNNPFSICINNAGDIFFSDQDNIMYYSLYSFIRKVDHVTGNISTVAGAGAVALFDVPAMSAMLGNVSGMCTNNTGDIYFNEISCSCRKIDSITDSVSEVGGNYYVESFNDNISGPVAYMHNPFGICVDYRNNVYVADSFNNRIRKIIQLTHTPTFAFGKGQTAYTCPGTALPIDTLMAITDVDSAQTETWNVITAPMHGTVAGLELTASCMGSASITTTSGASYTMDPSYSGIDSFQVQVSDGTLMDTTTIYVLQQTGQIDGANDVCVGVTATFVNGITGGTWSMPDNSLATVSPTGVVSGLKPGTTIITYTATGACGTISGTKTITVDEPLTPGSQTIIGPNTVCEQYTETYTDSLPGGTWKSMSGYISASGVLTPGSLGEIDVEYMLVNGCGVSNAQTFVTIDYCWETGVPEVAATPIISTYPNPVSTVLNIDWSGLPTGDATVTVAYIAGRTVMSKTLTNNGSNKGTMALNMANLQEGVYLMTIHSAAYHYTEKVVVQR